MVYTRARHSKIAMMTSVAQRVRAASSASAFISSAGSSSSTIAKLAK